jgi:hypothetical protein
MRWQARIAAYAGVGVAPGAVILGPHVSAWPSDAVGLTLVFAAGVATVCELFIVATGRPLR